MSCIGESDRNVENLFADAFDIRYIVSFQSTVFNAIYTHSACKALNWPIKNSKKNCFNAISTSEDPTTLLRASMASQEKIVRYRMLIKLVMRIF